jgi:hypothetical protein
MQDLTPLPARSSLARVPLQQNLLAGSAVSNQSALVANDALIANTQTLFDQVKADLNLTQGEVTMFIPDMPNVPPQNVPVMIAQANQAQAGDVNTVRTLGVCFPAPNSIYSLENVIEPIGDARAYLDIYEHQTANGSATTTVLQQPKHGILHLVTEADGNKFGEGVFDPTNLGYAYLPENGYVGKDRATILVDFGGIKVKVEYFFQAINGVLGNTGTTDRCRKGPYWKISSTLDANGTNTITSVEYQSPIIDASATTTDTAALASALSASILSTLSVDPSAVTLSLADLPNGTLGQAVGNTITLDDNAAGHNWFIDPTPWDNSEYLPTSNPYEWVAKEGSAAYGKMDMLSVLLHEYGHALGIDHSAANHDYMATTLTPGVRRMPSAEDLALMAQLIGEIKPTLSPTLSQSEREQDDTPINPSLPIGTTLGAILLGRLHRTDYGSWSPVFDSLSIPAPAPQFEIAANPKLENQEFDGGAGWSAEGAVAFANNSATLTETAASQTRLNQVFVLGEHDRFLSFTLASGLQANGNTPLPNPLPQAGEGANGAAGGSGFGPSDAFEVALLDANTGLSLMGSTGLTHNDAILNLQANGAEHKASGITRLDNADGSRTYLIDLAGIAAGTVVNLAFDLIGFGLGAAAGDSRITIRDLRLGVPQTADDSITLAERHRGQTTFSANIMPP